MYTPWLLLLGREQVEEGHHPSHPWHLKYTQYMVVVITIRQSSMKAVSSWQHVGQQGWVTQETWALTTKTPVTTTCKRQNQRDSWLEKPHVEFFFSHHILYLIARHCRYICEFPLRDLSLFFLSSSFNSSHGCLLRSWYMENIVLGTREIIFFICAVVTS